MTNPLIEELQAGPGSRELSDAVLRALNWSRPLKIPDSGFWYLGPGDLMRPSPTENLQDAVDLVADGWRVTHAYWDTARAVFNLMKRVYGEAMPLFVEQRAPTPALALSAALIKARSL